ncbi:hypothetical protein RFI_35857, partial [Reticulomyxa filosa]
SAIKKITKGITSNLALGLKEIVEMFTNNWFENSRSYLPPPITSVAKSPNASGGAIARDMTKQPNAPHSGGNALQKSEHSTVSTLSVDLNRMEVYVHDENIDKSLVIVRMGFTDLHVRSYSTCPDHRKVEASMLWHGSKFDEKNDNPSPLVCPWQCSIRVTQGTDPQMQLE